MTDTLHNWHNDLSLAQKLSIATDPATSGTKLEMLASDLDSQVRARVAERTNMPPRVEAELARDTDLGVLLKLCANMYAQDNTIESLVIRAVEELPEICDSDNGLALQEALLSRPRIGGDRAHRLLALNTTRLRPQEQQSLNEVLPSDYRDLSRFKEWYRTVHTAIDTQACFSFSANMDVEEMQDYLDTMSVPYQWFWWPHKKGTVLIAETEDGSVVGYENELPWMY